jgi:hypothetical protein
MTLTQHAAAEALKADAIAHQAWQRGDDCLACFAAEQAKRWFAIATREMV